MLKNSVIYLLAKRHVAGPYLENAINLCSFVEAHGWSAILSAWTNENDNKFSTVRKYKSILNFIIETKSDSYLSIKPSAIGFDPKLFEEIAETADKGNIRIHFDSLSPGLAARSFKLLKEARLIYENIGYTLSARWMRSISDAEEIIKINLPAVRIVKGQWPDPENLKIDSRKNFLKIVSLLAGNIASIAAATHDVQLAEKAIGIIKRSASCCELEQFFSLPLNCKSLAEENKIRMRIYIAFGKPYLPYNLKFIDERPAMVYWALRDILNLKPKYQNSTSTGYEQIKNSHELIQY